MLAAMLLHAPSFWCIDRNARTAWWLQVTAMGKPDSSSNLGTIKKLLLWQSMTNQKKCAKTLFYKNGYDRQLWELGKLNKWKYAVRTKWKHGRNQYFVSTADPHQPQSATCKTQSPDVWSQKDVFFTVVQRNKVSYCIASFQPIIH